MSLIRSTQVKGAGNDTAFVFPFGELFTAEKQNDVLVQFQYDYYDEQFDVDTPVTTGDGSVTVSGSLLNVSSASSGTALISSKDTIRYRPGHSGFIDFTLSASGSGTVRAGGFDSSEDNGFVIDITNGAMTFGYIKAGVNKGSAGAAGFDSVDTNGLDLTKLNIYRIVFGYLGVANASLFVKKDKWLHLHTVETEGVIDATHVNTPVFPITIKAENGATAKSGSWNGGVIGKDTPIGNRGFHFPNQLLGASPLQGTATVLSTGAVKTIVAFKSKTLFKSKPNNIRAKLVGYSFNVDVPAGSSSGEVIFQLIGVSAYTGTPSWNDIDNTSSVIQYDHVNGTGSAITPTSGRVILQDTITYVGLNKGGLTTNGQILADDIGAYAYAGDTFAIIAKNEGGADVDVRVVLYWSEQF